MKTLIIAHGVQHNMYEDRSNEAKRARIVIIDGAGVLYYGISEPGDGGDSAVWGKGLDSAVWGSPRIWPATN